MSMEIELDRVKLKEILDSIPPSKINLMLEEMVKQMAGTARRISIALLKPADPGRGTDFAQKSMRYEVQGTTAKVYSVMPERRAMSIEEGRHPGEDIALLAAARWLAGEQYLTSSRLSSRRDLKDEAYRTKAAIRQTGVKGKRFIAGAWDKINQEMPERMEKMAKTIEKKWGR